MKQNVNPGVAIAVVAVLVVALVLTYRYFNAAPTRIEDSTTVFKRPGPPIGPPPGAKGVYGSMQAGGNAAGATTPGH